MIVGFLSLIVVSQAQEDSTKEPTQSPSPTRSSETQTETPTNEQSGSKEDEEEQTTEEQGDIGSDEPTSEDELDSNDEPSFDESYDETGMPGSVSLTTPDYMTIPTPMFEIGQNITLGWEYSNDTKRPPKKLSICGKFPKGSNKSQDQRALCDWDIAVNISGSLRKYVWNTVTHGAPGAAFVADSGYLMYFYDSDYGVNNAVPGAGRIVPSVFWFNMYNSRYDLTNQGVPDGYNPSSAAMVRVGNLWWITTVAMLGITAVFFN
ncbi:hypothetical protein IWW36_000331 [Coemansia brasiliensis]|uniref:DUF7137 domain-containing protein n=1 Tax=Coemansia brasiliensis TaxID=2650707 RepID=A0A9W8IJ02_9FUNG|nr:hypothetical protein IWW36_000331 [Coemansia brasiliensis]